MKAKNAKCRLSKEKIQELLLIIESPFSSGMERARARALLAGLSSVSRRRN